MKDDLKETIKVNDRMDFYYEVIVQHTPSLGYSTAYYNDRIIAQCELGKLTKPNSDNDKEWEMYYERFAQWKDEVISNLKLECILFFNKQLPNK